MQGNNQSKRISKVRFCRLIKYALLSVFIVFGFSLIATSGSGSSESSEAGRYLYVASHYAISRIDKQTLEREVLAGNLIGINGNTDYHISWAQNLVADDNYLYFDSVGIKRLFTGDDGQSAIEIVVPQTGLLSGQGVNFNSMAVNDTQVFWVLTNGSETSYIHGKKLGSNDLPKVLTSVPNDAQLRASSSALFIATCCYDSGTPSIFKYNLVTETLELVQSDVVPPSTAIIPTALSATEYFWVNGDIIFRMAQSSVAPQVLVAGLSNIWHITADESALYALEGGLFDTNTIHKIDLPTGNTTPLVTADDIRNILVYNGKLYWISAYGLYTRNADGTITELYINDGSAIILGGAGGTEMMGVSGKVAVFAGFSWNKILFHDLSKSATKILELIAIEFMDANSDSLYFAGFNEGIGKIPLDLNLRAPETLKKETGGINSKIYLHNDWLYWSEYRDGSYLICRMKTNGSHYEVLFDKIHKELALYNNRLYFMCESGCSLPSWTIISMPLNGGTPVPEFELEYEPVMWIQKDGMFYTVVTPDGGWTNPIYAINIESKDSCGLFSGGSYYDVYEMQVLSSGWFYRLLESPGVDGELRRNSINGCIIGQDILIDPDPAGPNLVVNTFHSDDNSVYYWLWTKGLKRDRIPSPPELLLDARLFPIIYEITSGEMGKKKIMSMPQLMLLLGD